METLTMALPVKLTTYRMQMECMDKAEVNPDGVKVVMPNKAQATRFRAMCYRARKLYYELMGEDTIKWADLYITIENDCEVYIKQRSMDVISITALNGVEDYPSTLEYLDGLGAGGLRAAQRQAERNWERERQAPEVVMPEMGQARTVRTHKPKLPDIEVILPDDFDPNAPFASGEDLGLE